MFLQSLPAVPVSPLTYSLPLTGAATSFFLPKLAEQGFGVPIRRIDGDYWPAFQRRIGALLGHKEAARHLLHHQSPLLKALRQEHNPRVAGLVPRNGTVRSDFESDPSTCDALLSLLVLKELMDMESLGLDFPDGRRVKIDQNDVAYLKLLYGLEHMGAIDGIVYEYDVFRAGQVPEHEDVRRIFVSAGWISLISKSVSLTELEILKTLDHGQRFDGDAGPLHDFFAEAYRLGDPNKVKGLRRQAATFVTPFPPGRSHPVASKTVVEAV
jgi:hypothetical protein